MKALYCDLYALNMVQAYLDNGMTDEAVFEFFVRRLPPGRNFLMAAGLAQVAEFLDGLAIVPDEMRWLRESGRFKGNFLDYMENFRFSGDVDAMPEGTIFFADEPVVRVAAPLPEAQLIEARLMNILHFQTLVASKAARMVLAADGRSLIDFGLRRTHGAEAGLFAARAAYLAGFDGTATVAAGLAYGIPVAGTMAHSFIQAHDSETAAFEHFARARPEGLVLLLDTYDTEEAAHKVVALAGRLANEGITVSGVRLDSGDLADHARKVRTILDAAGLNKIRILVSGGIDEETIAALSTAPVDGFGVGGSLVTSSDHPVLDTAYKLQEYRGLARRKKSEGKATWPGRKQVFRQYQPDGKMFQDTLALEGETFPGEPLLVPVMRGGRPLAPLPDLAAIRRHAAAQRDRLPDAVARLERGPPYEVRVSARVRALADEVDRRVAAQDRADKASR
ncbi:MAG: nicotinate phosphoribosyltransferase [Rhodospirillales bacterium]|nr:nicotinate phosphoribosyltransferase [Rhodospirillales bacterium]